MQALSRIVRSLIISSIAASMALTAVPNSSHAGDVAWDNGSLDFLWNTTSANFGGAAWNNAGNDGAVFATTGVGNISLANAITVRSIHVIADGYTFDNGGAGSINFTTAGTSTISAATFNVMTGTTTLNVPINSTVGFYKTSYTGSAGLPTNGNGTLVLSGTNNITGNIAMTSNGNIRVDVVVGSPSNSTTGAAAGGTLRLSSATSLAATTRVGIGDGYLDIGSNNVTLGALTFANATNFAAWNTTLNANNGVVGTGTLKVTGDINVLGVTGGNYGNSIAANLDMNGGTQVFRISANGSFSTSNSLMITGSISNGSLLKTFGFGASGAFAAGDGIGLFGNNTYTGSTIINGGTIGNNATTGTNASTSLKVVAASLSLQGANGSYGAANTVSVFSGGVLVLDNNAAIGASGNNAPNIPAANNTNRLSDSAAVELRDSGLTLRGLSTAASSETIGSLTASGGHNTVTITPNGTGGAATLTVAGDLALGSNATLQVSGTTLGAAGKVFVNGALPASVGGILSRMVGSSDFLTYNGATGITPFTGYATDFSTANANVALTAASTAPTQTINALKTAGTFTTTIGAGNTLTVTSGMIFNTTGTQTISGGTLDFGATPGAIFGGTTNISSAITGSQGLIKANGTLTLSGDLSGLAGTMRLHSGTTTLSTNTFGGAIEVRQGTLNIGVNNLSAGGAITMGVSANDSNLGSTPPSLSISAAGANAIINRAIIIDNGSTNLAGVANPTSLQVTMSPLSNTTGSQTVNSSITLNSGLNFQGGGGGGSGATNFTGNISGSGIFMIPNGRVNFTSTSVLNNAGGMFISNLGFTAIVNFAGTNTSSGNLTIQGGNNTSVSYATQSNLYGGDITVQNATGSVAPTIKILASSSISNRINLNGDTIAETGTGINAAWAGQITGASQLTKTGAGSLTLSNATNTHAGNVAVNVGKLVVNGALGGTVTVASGATLGGNGTLGGTVTLNAGSKLAPGASVGSLTVNNSLTFNGGTGSTWEVELSGPAAANADRVIVNGASKFLDMVQSSSSKITMSLTNVGGPLPITPRDYIVAEALGGAGFRTNGGAFAFNAADWQFISTNFSTPLNPFLYVSGNYLMLHFSRSTLHGDTLDYGSGPEDTFVPGGGGRFTGAPVPEPNSLFLMIFGCGAAVAVFRHVLRQKRNALSC